MTPVGYGSASPAVIYTKMTFPSDIQDYQPDSAEYTVVGEAQGSSQTNNVLGIIASGDGGLKAAYDDACEKADCDDVINIKVDTEVESILGLFARVTTYLNGTGIKYTQSR